MAAAFDLQSSNMNSKLYNNRATASHMPLWDPAVPNSHVAFSNQENQFATLVAECRRIANKAGKNSKGLALLGIAILNHVGMAKPVLYAKSDADLSGYDIYKSPIYIIWRGAEKPILLGQGKVPVTNHNATLDAYATIITKQLQRLKGATPVVEAAIFEIMAISAYRDTFIDTATVANMLYNAGEDYLKQKFVTVKEAVKDGLISQFVLDQIKDAKISKEAQALVKVSLDDNGQIADHLNNTVTPKFKIGKGSKARDVCDLGHVHELGVALKTVPKKLVKQVNKLVSILANLDLSRGHGRLRSPKASRRGSNGQRLAGLALGNECAPYSSRVDGEARTNGFMRDMYNQERRGIQDIRVGLHGPLN